MSDVWTSICIRVSTQRQIDQFIQDLLDEYDDGNIVLPGEERGRDGRFTSAQEHRGKPSRDFAIREMIRRIKAQRHRARKQRQKRIVPPSVLTG